MKHNVEKLENGKVAITVTLSQEEFAVYQEEALGGLLAKAEVKGFRKGKVPRNIYLNKFGEGEAIQIAMDNAINRSYSEVVKTADIKVIASPEIDVDFEEFNKDKTFIYTAKVAVLPEVELGKYFGVEVTKETAEVTEEDINNRISNDLKKKSDLELVEDAPLELGNTAIFDFEGFKDGVPFDGGKAENYSLEIGSGQFIPGFEEQMIGMMPEEEKSIHLSFPESYHVEDLKGQAVVFEVKLHEVKKRVTPELSDELVVDLAIEGVNNVDEYKSYVKEELENTKADNVENKFINDLLQTVCDNAKVEIPEELVHQRVHDMIHQEEHRAESYGIKFEQLLQYQGMTLDQYEENITPVAHRDVLRELVIDKIVEVEKIDLTEEDYEAGYVNYAEVNGYQLEEVKKQLPKDRIRYQFLMDKAVNLIKEKAIIKN